MQTPPRSPGRRRWGVAAVAALGLSISTAACVPAGLPVSSRPPASTATCAPLGRATTAGTLGNPEVTESSGLAVGVRSPGVLFTHNDAGDTARFYALGTDGRPLGDFVVAGATNVDWEDMAIGTGPVPGVSYIYLADIGGSRSHRSVVTVYRVPEPLVDGAGPGTTATTVLHDVARFELPYPDGVHDAETLLFDPPTGDAYIVSKDSWTVYRFHPTSGSATLTLEKVGTITPPAGAGTPTGGAVSPDGSTVVVRTYGRVLRYRRPVGTTLTEALSGTPCVDRLAPQPLGEAVAFDPSGRALWVSSEGAATALQSYSVN